MDLSALIQSAGQQYNVDPSLIHAVIQTESSGNPNAVGPQTQYGQAQGLGQFIPATAKSLGISNPFDPAQAVPGIAKLLSENLDRYGDVQKAISAYHGGTDPANWGPKTQAYVQKVAANYGGAQMPTQQQPQDLPGLPPVNGPQQGMVDPFAKFRGDASQQAQVGVPANSQGMVDPFAKFRGDNGTAPAASPAVPPVMRAPQVQQGPQPGMLASLGAGLGHGFGETVLGAQQLLGRGLQKLGGMGQSPNLTSVVTGQQPQNLIQRAGSWLSNDADQGIAKLNQQFAPYQAANPITAGAGNIGGMVGATAPLAAFAPEMAGTGLMGRAATGAALGAANGLVSPVENVQQTPGGDDFWSQKAKQMAIGAGVGAAAVPITAGIGAAVKGISDPIRQQLADAGVTMTPGQLLGGGWQALENKMTSLPIIGDVIKGGQQRAVQDFNRATYNEVLAPLGQTYSGAVGQEGIDAVRKTVSNAYKNALGNMTFRATDPQFQTDITNLAGMAQGLPAAQQKTFMNTLQTQVFGKLGPQGMMDGPTLQGAQSELGRIARGYSGDASFDNRQLGAAIGEIKNAIDASLPRYNAADAVAQKNAADAAYANFVRLRGAAGSQGAMNNGGIFSPAQLQSAVRGADKSVGKGASATGNALMQDWSQNAMGVLGKGYPDSGTAGRLGTAGAIGALISHPGMLLSPWTYAGAAPALAYTPLGQRAAQGLLMSRPAAAQAVGNAITNGLAPLTPGLLGAVTNR